MKFEDYLDIVRTNYCAYVEYVHDNRWIPSKFHRFLCDTVQEFIEEKTDNAYSILIISTAPQHGKSESITQTLPSWYLGRNPYNKVIEVSYNEDFATEFGRANNSKIKEYGQELFGIGLASQPNTATEFRLANGVGGMISRGILSGITGKGGNLVIIDDPIKNREEADSETHRNKIFGEWLNSIKSRLAPDAKVILIMTRWHEDDLAGRIMETEHNVKVINLPCEAEDNDPLGRKRGEPLCPEIGKGEKWLADFKKSYQTLEGSRAWNALFQGRPTSAEGNLFKREWWGYYDDPPEIVEYVMGADCTFKDKDDSDYVAIQVWGKTGANIYLIDAVKKHLNLPDTMREITRLRALYPHCKVTLIEDKANGSAIINILRKMMTGIIAVEPRGGKYARANAIVGCIESGNVYLPRKKHFTGDFVEELASFPNGKHDDQVDCASMCLNRLVYSQAQMKEIKKADILQELFPEYKKKPKKWGKGGKINVV